MLKIHIDLHPFGIEESRRIGVLEIWNDGKNKERPFYGDYGYRISDVPFGSDVIEEFTSGNLTNFERKRGPWALVLEVLENIGEEINVTFWNETKEI